MHREKTGYITDTGAEALRPPVSTQANALAVAEWVGANQERLEQLEDLLKDRSVTEGSIYESRDGAIRIELGRNGVTIGLRTVASS